MYKNIFSIYFYVFIFVALLLNIDLILPAAYSVKAKDSILQKEERDLTTLELEGAVLAQANNIPSSFRFNKNLWLGRKSKDVKYLQTFLNMSADTKLALSGFGSSGNETDFFGPLTFSAIKKFQALYSDEILKPWDLTQPTGFVGIFTRAKINSILNATTTPPPPSGENILNVSSGARPVNSLAVSRAARIPFTKINFTAGNTADTIIRNLTIKRTGLASDSVFKNIVLLDENENAVGPLKFFDSNHEAVIGEQIIIPKGQIKTFTIAGNMNTSLSSFNGQTVSIDLIRVNVLGTTTVRGSLPITGSTHTINSSLDIGTATARVGSLGVSKSTKEVGALNYPFSSITLTSGQAENIKLMSIRWIQDGTVSAGDLRNVITIVNGNAYPALISNDGKFYVSNFGSGIIINRGTSREINIRADIVSGTGRTIKFNIENAQDIFVKGENFGFGILPVASNTSSPSDSSTEFTTGTPFFDGAEVNISGGSVVASRANSVPTQNIGIQVSNQTLGGFNVNVKGENINIQSIEFDISIRRASGSDSDVSDINDIILVNQNGTILSGPRDAEGAGTGSVIFDNSFNLSSGDNVLTLKGELTDNFKNGDRITISFRPSTDIKNIIGGVSGNAITASPNSNISGNTMTVRDTKITVSLSPAPISQSVVAGTRDFVFVNFIIDALNSGENVRISSFSARFTASDNPHDIDNCRIFKGNENLTTGSNIENPTSSFISGNNIIFTFDSSLTVQKNTTETLTLKCDISSSADAGTTYRFGLNTAPNFTGVDSGRSINANFESSAGQIMTISGSGAFSVEKSSASPSYQIGLSGENLTLGILRFRAKSEAARVNQIAFELSGTSASSSPSDFGTITLFDQNTQVGSFMFSGNSRFATSTLLEDFIIPQNGTRDLTIKTSLSEVGTNKPGKEGSLIKVNYDGNNASSTRGVGVSSGSLLMSNTTADTDFPGVRLFKTAPEFSKDNLNSNVLANGERILMRFKVNAASAEDVGIHKFTLKFSLSDADISDINIFAFSNSGYSTPISGLSSDGQMDNTDKNLNSNNEVEIFSEDSDGQPSPIQIPSEETRYFEVRGTITGSISGSEIITTLRGDSSYPPLSTLMGTASQIDSTANDNFIWSPNTFGESETTDIDFTNGFGIHGLPSGGISETLSR